MSKNQDWIIANINNPGFSAGDFKSIGLTTSDMLLRPIDDYLKSSLITENPLFKDDNGDFSKKKFEDFYNYSVGKYQQFSLDIDTFKYDLFDPFRNVNSEIRDPQIKLYQVSNPEHSTIGIIGRNEIGKGDLTAKELAQQSKVFDPSTNKYLDYSVNDVSLLESPIKWLELLFSDPIIYATYEDDGFHIDPITKQEVKHKKGLFKVNDDGEYYTEKLSGRNIRGKEIVSIFDNITPETSAINKYDFFDSDGFDKSVVGSFFNAAATIAPLFIPYVGEIYSGMLVSRELTKAVPMLGGMIDSVLGTNLENNSLLNTLAGKAELLTGGSSEYAREKLFSFENIAKLASDVATQWGQLKIIAKGINKLTGADKLIAEANINAQAFYQFNTINQGRSLKSAVEAGEMTQKAAAKLLKVMSGISSLDELDDIIKSGKWAETALGKGSVTKFIEPTKKTVEGLNRLAADMSLGYMAIVSNTDVYQSLLDHGATKGEAALFTLGSTIGMFSVDRFANLGEVFFDELRNENKYIKRNIKEMVEPWAEELKSTAKLETTNSFKKKIIEKGKKFGVDYVTKYIDDLKNHTTSFLGKALGEGLEETAEELVTDFTKALYEQLGNLGITSLTNVGAFENMGSRYLMSFLGGSLGGGIFYGVGLAQGQYPIQSADEDLLFHIRNGKLDNYLKKVDEWEEKGKFGRTDLSATRYTETENDGKKERVYLSADSAEDSQNHYIADRVRLGIIQLDGIIRGNNLDLTDEQLFDNLIMTQLRYEDMREWLLDASYATSYYDVYQDLVKRIVNVEQQLQLARKTKDGTPESTEKVDDEWIRTNKNTEEGRIREENIKKLEDLKALLLKLKDEFLSGDTSFYYTRKLLFALDPEISRNFSPIKFRDWLKTLKNVEDVSTLSKLDYTSNLDEYYQYLQTTAKSELTDRFNLFLLLEKKLAPILKGLEGTDKDFYENEEKLKKIFEGTFNEEGEQVEKSKIVQYLLSINEDNKENILEGESSEDFAKYLEITVKLKNKELITQEENEFLRNRDKKWELYKEQTRSKVQKEILELLKGSDAKLDPDNYRRIITYMLTPFRFGVKSIVKQFLKNNFGLLLWDDNTRIDNNHERYLQAREKYNLDEDSLTLEEADLIDYHDNAVAVHNESVSSFMDPNLLPPLLVEKISQYIERTLYYNEDGTSNIDSIYSGVKDLIKNYNSTVKANITNIQQDRITTLNNILINLSKRKGDSLIENPVYDELIEELREEGLTDLEVRLSSRFVLGYDPDLEEFDEGLNSDVNQNWVIYLIPLNKLEIILNYLLKNKSELSEAEVNFINGLKNNLLESKLDKNKSFNDYIDYMINSESGQFTSEDLDKEDKDLTKEYQQLEAEGKTKTEQAVKIRNALNIKRELERLFGIREVEGGTPDVAHSLKGLLTIDKNLLFVRDLYEIAKTSNPYTSFISKIALALGIDGLEEDLNNIYDIMYNQGYEEVKLSVELRDKFKKIEEVIKIANSYLFAASKRATIMSPYGHNNTINSLSKSEEKLPEIEESTLYLYNLESNRMMGFIKVMLMFDELNQANKKIRALRTKTKFTNAKLEFLEKLAPKLKFTSDSGDIIDLLDGKDSIPEDIPDAVKLGRIEEILYLNFNALLEKGYSVELIFEKTGVFNLILENDVGTSLKFDRQISGKLDENYTYNDFTSYDRFIYLTSILALNTRDWNLHLDNETRDEANGRIVPLTALLYDARVVTSFLSNSLLFLKAIDFILKKGIADLSTLKVLKKSIFLSGIGGAGKTQVGAKYAVDYLIQKLGINSDDIIITGSTDRVRKNIQNVLGVGKIIDKEKDVQGNLSIIKEAVGESVYSKIIDELKIVNDPNKDTSGLLYIKLLDSGDRNKISLNTEKILPLLKKDSAPEVIVLDEATHLSSIELLILDLWAKRGVLLIGDLSQSGYIGKGGSIDFEYNFMLRTPKLGLSLRDNNILNILNLSILTNLLEDIKALDENLSVEEYRKLAGEIIQNRIGRLKIRGYNQNIINGVVHVSEITPEIIEKITQDKKATIAYLGGRTLKSYEKLEKAVKDDPNRLSVFLDIRSILGQEFDYVIVDSNFLKDLKENLDSQRNNTTKLFSWYLILRDFYTVISRARIGTIIRADWIPGTNIIDLTQVTSESIVRYLDEFKNSELSELEKFILLNKFLSKYSSPEAPSSETTEDTSEEDISEEEDTSEEDTSEEEEDTSEEEEEEENTSEEENTTLEEEVVSDTEEDTSEEGTLEDLTETNINSDEGSEFDNNDDREEDTGYTEITDEDGSIVKVYSEPTEESLQQSEELVQQDEDLNLNIEAASDISFPIYTGFVLLGAKRSKVLTQNGENWGDWILDMSSDRKSPILRDAEIFLDYYRKQNGLLQIGLRSVYGLLGDISKTLRGIDPSSEEYREKYNSIIEEFNSKRSLIESLLSYLKYAIINDLSWDTVETHIKLFITENEFEELKKNTYIVIEDIDEDRDIIIGTNVGVTSDIINKATRSGKSIKLVARSGNKSITLGLALSIDSEKTEESHKKKFIKILTDKINRAERLIKQEESKEIPNLDEISRNLEVINLDQLLIHNIDTSMLSYRNSISNIEELENGERRVSLNTVNSVSRIQPIYRKNQESDEERDERLMSNIAKNRTVSYSRPFIYLGGLPGVSDKLRGRVIVFGVSSPITNYNLRDTYERQKKREIKNGTVRMLALSGRGAHLNDLSRIIGTYIFGKEIDSEKSLPVVWSEVGVRMFGAFWNFRTSLLLFNQRVDSFIDLLINEGILSNKNEFYTALLFITETGRVSTSKDAIRFGKDKIGKFLQRVREFNKKLDEDNIRWFRLSNRLLGRKYPSLYIGTNDSGENFIFIHPKRALLFQDVIDRVYNSIILNSNINLNPFIQGEDPILIEGKSKDNTHPNYSNIRGALFKAKGDTKYKYGSGKNEVVIGTSREFARLGLALTRFYSYFGWTGGDFLEGFEFTVFKDDEDQATFNLSDFISGLSDNPETGYTRTDVGDIMRLMIHGTTVLGDGVEKETGNYAPQYDFKLTKKASDAYYKRGVFMEPIKLTSTLEGYGDRSDYFIPINLEHWAFTTDAVVEGQVIFAVPYTELIEREEEISTLYLTAGVSSDSELKDKLTDHIRKTFGNSDLVINVINDISNRDTFNYDENYKDLLTKIEQNIITQVKDSQKNTSIHKVYVINLEGNIQRLIDLIEGEVLLYHKSTESNNTWILYKKGSTNVINIIYNDNGTFELYEQKTLIEDETLNVEFDSNLIPDIVNEIYENVEFDNFTEDETKLKILEILTLIVHILTSVNNGQDFNTIISDILEGLLNSLKYNGTYKIELNNIVTAIAELFDGSDFNISMNSDLEEFFNIIGKNIVIPIIKQAYSGIEVDSDTSYLDLIDKTDNLNFCVKK